MVSTIQVFHKQIYRTKHLRKEIYLRVYICGSSEFRPVVLIKESIISWESFSKYKHMSLPKILIFLFPVADC